MTRESRKPKTNWHDVKHAIDTKIHEDQRLFKEPLTIHLVTPMFGEGPNQTQLIKTDRFEKVQFVDIFVSGGVQLEELPAKMRMNYLKEKQRYLVIQNKRVKFKW